MNPKELLQSVNLREELIASGRKNRPGTKIRPASITIHNTDNTARGADARAHSSFVRNTGYYMLDGKKHWVSWHYTVDDNQAIRQLPDNEAAYHAGSAANAASIAMEICMNRGINQPIADDRAARLAAWLLHINGLGIQDMVPHKKWTGKNCPSLLLPPGKWRAFRTAVERYLTGIAAETVSEALVTPAAFEGCRECGVPAFETAGSRLVGTLKERPGGDSSIPLRNINVYEMPGTKGYYYNAAMAIDVDGSPRAYSAGARTPAALDGPGSVDAGGFETMYVQGREKTVHGVRHLGEGPHKDFYVSRTSLLYNSRETYRTSNFPDAEFIPYVVFPKPSDKFPGLRLGDMAYVINLANRKATHAIFADTNPRVGEASLAVARALGRPDLSASNGEDRDVFVYILFPGTAFAPLASVPHWPDAKIKTEADRAFAAWGGMAQVEKIFG